MSTKSHSQNKFMRIITTPIRVLCKARDNYVKCMTVCATKVSYGHSMAMPQGDYSVLPRSFSTNSSISNDNEDFRELLRAASVRSFGHRSEVDMYLQQLKQQSSNVGSKPLPKSCSVGMGFMGRIDEDSPCEFEEDGGGSKAELYPRSRSYAVAKRNAVF